MNKMYTLSKDARAREFGYLEEDEGLMIFTGSNLETEFYISDNDIEQMLFYFSNKDWFVLGNQIDDVKPNGLGDYFKSELRASPKFASHVAAYLVRAGKLFHQDVNGYLEFKAKQ